MRPDGTLAKTTAACGPLIYRGDNFPPEYQGNAFVCEPAGNLIIRDILIEHDGQISGRKAYTNEDFLASTDERFRPTSLYNGPDGALYITDFYHGILEHRLSLTTYLRRQIQSRHLEAPVGLGTNLPGILRRKPSGPADLGRTEFHPIGRKTEQSQGLGAGYRAEVAGGGPAMVAWFRRCATRLSTPAIQ